MLLQQSGKCALCTDTFEQRPCIDHSHETGEVRGLLCSPCNFAVGYIEKIQRKHPNIGERIAEYLKSRSTK